MMLVTYVNIYITVSAKNATVCIFSALLVDDYVIIIR